MANENNKILATTDEFGRDIKTIGKHINNALHEELASDPTGANFATIENGKTVEKEAKSFVKTTT